MKRNQDKISLWRRKPTLNRQWYKPEGPIWSFAELFDFASADAIYPEDLRPEFKWKNRVYNS